MLCYIVGVYLIITLYICIYEIQSNIAFAKLINLGKKTSKQVFKQNWSVFIIGVTWPIWVTQCVYVIIWLKAQDYYEYLKNRHRR